MSLNGNADSSKEAFVQAMKKRLDAEREGMSENLNEPGVKPNLGALGQAVYDILIMAETVAVAPTEPSESPEINIWSWMQAVQAWMEAVNNQATAQGLTELPALPADVPTEIRGKVE